MGATSDALMALQEVEYQIVDIRRQLRKKENVVAAHEKKLTDLRRGLEAAKAELQRIQIEFQSLDVDVKARSATIQKHREQLNTIKTNKEYAAMLAQLNNDKADLTRIEQQALDRMQAVEQRQADMAVKAEQIRAEEAKRDELLDQAQQARKSYDSHLRELESKRAAAAAKVPADVLRTFERLSERYDGDAIARVERTHPRKDEFICGGCNLAVRQEVANSLMTRDDVLTCKNCGRIMTVAGSI